MLQATGLKKSYGDIEALKGLDMTVECGDIYCLLGANGAGKTTTISLFLNFIRPDGGAATVCGLDVTEQPLETKKGQSSCFSRWPCPPGRRTRARRSWS